MSDNFESSLINLGELSKPATVLVEKISEAVGGVFKPEREPSKSGNRRKGTYKRAKRIVVSRSLPLS
jgi:hypothetical protein